MEDEILEHLCEDDIRLLVRHPDDAKRVAAAQRICRTVRDVPLSDEERKFARRLLRFMADDAVAMVRRALAITLMNSPELPRHLAQKLARDIDNIAIPVLENSPVFTDEDLINVIRSKATAKIMAIAKRPSVSGTLVDAIVRYGNSRAVAEVAANDGAIIDIRTAGSILELYRDDDLIKEAFITRRDLPIAVLEKLITIVSAEAALLLKRRHSIPKHIAVELANRTRERATLGLIDDKMSGQDTHLLVQRLHDEGRLDGSMLIRAVGLGKMQFVNYTLSALSGVKPAKTALMLHDSGPFGLKSICEKAGLSHHDTRIIRAGCAIYRDLEQTGVEYDEVFFRSLMIERMLTLPLALPEAEQTWFLEKLDALSDEGDMSQSAC